MSKLCRKLLVLFVAFLFSGVLAVSLSACGGRGGSDITYKVNFYSDADTNYAVVEVGEDGAFRLPTNPTKSGFVFTGWYTDAATTTAFDSSATISANLNLYAGWRQLPSAPSGLKWNAKTETLSWNSVSTAEGYSYTLSIDGTEISGLTATSYAYSNVGDHEAKVKTVYTTASFTDNSSWSNSVSFSIEAPTYTVNFMNGTALYQAVEVEDGSITLPTAPSQTDAHFLGWYIDSTFATAFNASNVMDLFSLTEKGDQTVSVYAKWEYKPAAPAAVNRAAYENAKAGNPQRIYWAAPATSGIAGYEVSVTNISGVEVLGATVTTNEFVLDQTKLTEGTTYFYDIVTVSTTQWENAALKSAAYSGSFTYTIVPEDTFTVTYMIDATTKYLSEYVTDGDTAALPNIDPVKTGYVFLKWVYGANEDDFTNEVVINENVTVYARWAAKPVAPATVAYTDSLNRLIWDAVEGATKYECRIDNGDWVTVAADTPCVALPVSGLAKGTHNFDIKVFAPVDGVTGVVESEVSELLFTVSTVYVGLSVNGEVANYVAADSDGHIVAANPSLAGYKFIKWTLDGNVASSGLNLSTYVFNNTTTIYAIFAEIPAQVTSATWDEETDTISWDPVEGATSYIVKYGSFSTNGVTVTEPRITDVGATQNGYFPISIITVRTDSIYGTVKSEESEINVTIQFSAELIYSSDGTQMKYKTGTDTYIYIFFAGQTYSSSAKPFGASEYYSGSGNYVTMTTDPEKVNVVFDYGFGSETRQGMVVPQVLSLSYADGYARYNNQINGSTFVNLEHSYKVGTSANEITGNVNFYLPVDFTFGAGASFDDANVALDFTFYKWNDGTSAFDIDITASNQFSFISANGQYLLSTSLDSGRIKVVIQPRFLNKSQYDAVIGGSEAYTKTFIFELNDGINIYNHAELKEAYHDTDVAEINIHGGTIVSELADTQLTLSGHANNWSDPNVDYSIAGDVYKRIATGNDYLVINGNYALIDAHNVQKVFYMGETGHGGMNGPTKDYKTVQNVAVGIFKYHGNSTKDTHYNARLTLNDLEIYGNTEIKGANESEVTTYSGGHNGIYVNETAATVNNVYIHNALIANYSTSWYNYDNYYYINETICDQNWANGIDSSGTAGLILTKSQFLACSGAAIHFEDRVESENPTPTYMSTAGTAAAATEVRKDPLVAIDNETVLENWMTGSEAWFTAWGFGGVMSTQIKGSAGVQGTITTQLGTSVLKGTAAETKFNLAMLFKPETDYSQLEVYFIDEDYGYVLGSANIPSGEGITASPSTVTNWSADPRFQEGEHGVVDGKLLTPVGNMTDPGFAVQVATYGQAYVSGANPDASSPAYNLLTPEIVAALESQISANPAGTATIIGNVITYATYGGQFGYAPFTPGNKTFYSVTIDGAMSNGHTGAPLSVWIEYGSASDSANGWYNTYWEAE